MRAAAPGLKLGDCVYRQSKPALHRRPPCASISSHMSCLMDQSASVGGSVSSVSDLRGALSRKTLVLEGPLSAFKE